MRHDHPGGPDPRPLRSSRLRRPLRVGFVALNDGAPFIVAQEWGLFRRFGVEVILSRELGWATIRDKVVFGDLDAAHAVAGLPFAATLGLGSVQCDCLTALVINLNGNAITLSRALYERGVRDGVSLRREVIRSRHERLLTFGVVYPYSSHHYLLRRWLVDAGIDPDHDVRIVVVPPPLMAANLMSGNLDGFCAGEPWNAVAALRKVGWCAATSAEWDPGHPEKVLMVRRDFAEHHPDEHLGLVAALWEACRICEDPCHREEILGLLARPQYLRVPREALLWGFEGRCGNGSGDSRIVPDFNVFRRGTSNEPTGDKAARVMQSLRVGEVPAAARQLGLSLSQRVFRTDLFDQVRAMLNADQPRPFDNHDSYETETSTLRA